MEWEYEVATRKFSLNGTYQFSARYSGRPGYYDDSTKECVAGKGPIPRGVYTIGKPFTHPKTKAWTMRLTPGINNNMCGRDSFMIHGDSQSHPGEASDGCIIVILANRKKIAESRVYKLIVK